MADSNCDQNFDALKLGRDGTNQEQRPFPVLNDAAIAPEIDGHTSAHNMVFGYALSAFLKYYAQTNTGADSWQHFFGQDISLQLALLAIQDVDEYRLQVKGYLDSLNDTNNNDPAYENACKTNLGYLFSCVGTLAVRFDKLSTELPDEFPIKSLLKTCIQNQLAPHFQRLWQYYKGDQISSAFNINNEVAPISILSKNAISVSEVFDYSFSNIWFQPPYMDLSSFISYVAAHPLNEYGSGSVVEQINHLSTHNLFTSIFDQFLKTYARLVADAKDALEKSLTNHDRHEPHYALFLSFLKLMEHPRREVNTLTGRHLDFYYREILKLKEKPAQPGQAHLLLELAKHVDTYELKKGELFKAGTDDLGKDVFFIHERDFVVNKAKVVDLKTIYRHSYKTAIKLLQKNRFLSSKNFASAIALKSKIVFRQFSTPTGGKYFYNTIYDRLYASPVSNSEDGIGAELLSEDKSWHPFFNHLFEEDNVIAVKMPEAEIGFALASHYLWMAEGERTITLDFNIESGITGNSDLEYDPEGFECFLTGEKDWLIKKPKSVKFLGTQFKKTLQVIIVLGGADPAILPYNLKSHGYSFNIHLPVLIVKLKHQKDNYYFSAFQGVKINSIALSVDVKGLRTLAVSNDFGKVDTSKPFQPFGAMPIKGGSLIFGSKELFGKDCQSASIYINWLNTPQYYISKTLKTPDTP
jgi:hypothetical protein